MSEVWKIVLTSSITITGGVVVYVLGHFLVILYVEPIHRLLNLIGEIADSLVFYANVIGNPGSVHREMMDEASKTLRRQASGLRAKSHSIPGYWFWAFASLVPQKVNIQEASRKLIGLSNSVYDKSSARDNIDAQHKIEQLLNIIGGTEQKNSRSINIRMLSHGILLFLFSLMLLGLQENTVVLYGLKILTPPIGYYTVLGIMALFISTLFMIAVFWKWLAVRVEGCLEGRSSNRWQAIAQYSYFLVFWLVYFAGWLKGLASVPTEKFVFHLAFLLGLVWFFIIPIARFRNFFQQRKN